MKTRLTMIILVLVCVLVLSACGCKHETWNDANCETPRTCAECGETEGAPLGHTWTVATCETPKTCVECSKTEGEALGHAWADATCETAKTCAGCGLTEGDALGHNWLDATTEAPKTCENCNLTEGERIVTDPRFTTAATAAVHGKWGHSLEVTGEMIQEPGFTGVLKYKVIMELGNDGTMSVYVTMEDASDMYAYLKDAMYAELAASGLNKEQADIAIKQATGMTMDEYIEYMFSMIDFDQLLGSVNYTGVYYVDGDKLYTGISWDGEMGADTFAVEGDDLILHVDMFDMGGETTVYHRLADGE